MSESSSSEVKHVSHRPSEGAEISSKSKGDGILSVWDALPVLQPKGLGYIPPLSSILHVAFSANSSYDPTLIESLLVNNYDSFPLYTLEQLQNFKSDLLIFSDGWLNNRQEKQESLQKLGRDSFSKEFSPDSKLFSFWLGNGMNHHILAVLDARVNKWIRLKMKNSTESDLFEVL